MAILQLKKVLYPKFHKIFQIIKIEEKVSFCELSSILINILFIFSLKLIDFINFKFFKILLINLNLFFTINFI
jgi:hypothetical protein